MFSAEIIQDVNSRFRRVADQAHDLRDLFNNGATVTQLKASRNQLELTVGELISICPVRADGTYLERHIAFMEHFLNKGEPEKCANDIIDICERDLPGYHQIVLDWYLGSHNYDSELRDSLSPLLLSDLWDSAIRKAFTLLKSRLVARYGASPTNDGVKLINEIFGQNGLASASMADSEREAARNMLSGLYGVFRNRYTHNNRKANAADTTAVVSVVNWALLDLTPTLHRSRSTDPASTTAW